jgi:hypothetical protein
LVLPFLLGYIYKSRPLFSLPSWHFGSCYGGREKELQEIWDKAPKTFGKPNSVLLSTNI